MLILKIALISVVGLSSSIMIFVEKKSFELKIFIVVTIIASAFIAIQGQIASSKLKNEVSGVETLETGQVLIGGFKIGDPITYWKQLYDAYHNYCLRNNPKEALKIINNQEKDYPKAAKSERNLIRAVALYQEENYQDSKSIMDSIDIKEITSDGNGIFKQIYYDFYGVMYGNLEKCKEAEESFENSININADPEVTNSSKYNLKLIKGKCK